MPNVFYISTDGTRRTEMDQALLGLSVTNTVETIPHALLEFKDGSPAEQNFKLSNQTWLKPGAVLSIELGSDADTVATVFEGVITHLRIGAQNTGYYSLEVECKHAAYRMTLSRRMRFFHNDVASSGDTVATISDQEALDQLSQEYNIPISTAPHPERDYQDIVHENLPQYGSSDWDFLMMRAEATGRLVRCVEGGIELIIPDPVEAAESALPTLVFGGADPNILEFNAEMDGSLHTETAAATSWDIDDQVLQSEQNTTTHWDLQGNLTVEELAKAAGSSREELFHSGDLLKQEARAVGYATMQRNTLAKIRATIKVVGDATLVPGSWVYLDGLGDKWNGSLFVGGVSHDLVDGLWETTVQIGIDPDKHAERYAVHYPPSVNLMPGVEGLLYGKVLQYVRSNGGHELVEVVIFSADELDPEGPTRTLYARLATLMAGAGGSAVFRPDVDDEVVVGFISGDPRFPVILGALHNTQTPPHWPLTDEGFLVQKKRGLRVAKQNGEWSLLFDEENDVLSINSADFSVELDDKKGKLILKDVSKANQIVMDKDGIKVESQKAIVLESGKGSVIELDASVTIKNASGKIVLDAKEIEQKAKTGLKSQAATIKFN